MSIFRLPLGYPTTSSGAADKSASLGERWREGGWRSPIKLGGSQPAPTATGALSNLPGRQVSSFTSVQWEVPGQGGDATGSETVRPETFRAGAPVSKRVHCAVSNKKVPGFLVPAHDGAEPTIAAFRAPGDELGYHEVQTGNLCGLHTLNMLATTFPLALESDWRAFAQATGRDPRQLDLADVQAFQAWRREREPGADHPPLSVCTAVQDESAGLVGVAVDLATVLAGAQSFGVAYQSRRNARGNAYQHNVVIRNVGGIFMVFDSRDIRPEALEASSAEHALREFVHRRADPYAAQVDVLTVDPAA